MPSWVLPLRRRKSGRLPKRNTKDQDETVSKHQDGCGGSELPARSLAFFPPDQPAWLPHFPTTPFAVKCGTIDKDRLVGVWVDFPLQTLIESLDEIRGPTRPDG